MKEVASVTLRPGATSEVLTVIADQLRDVDGITVEGNGATLMIYEHCD